MGARSWSEQLRPKKTICYFTTRSQKPEPAVSVPAMPQVTLEPPAAPVVNDAPTLSNRIFGTLTAIGGIAEAAVGGIGVIAGIGSANPLLIGGGGVVGLNGIDNAQAGMRQAISGKPVQTATSTAVEAVTGSHLAGEGRNLAIGLVGPGAVAKVATGKGLIASIKSVGSDAWKGLKNAGSSVKNWWKGTPKEIPQVLPTVPKPRMGNIGNQAPISADDALKAATQWLGPGYKEIGPKGSGVFRSADGLRQFRMTTSDLDPLGHGAKSGIGSHVHFEALDNRGRIIENMHVPIY